MMNGSVVATLFAAVCAVAVPRVSFAEAPKAPAEKKIQWFEASDLPLEGLAFVSRQSPFDRLPAEAQGKVSEQAWSASHAPAGAQIRFRTDSRKLHFLIEPSKAGCPLPSNVSTSGRISIDVYRLLADNTWEFVKAFPPSGRDFALGWTPGQAVLVNLPHYGRYERFRIGLEPDATWQKLEPRPTDLLKPVVICGASPAFTPGLSRPGMGFANLIGRRTGREVVDLAFYGDEGTDPALAPFAAQVDAACYVVGAVSETSDVATVGKRAEAFLRALRKVRPDAPVLICEADCRALDGNTALRRHWRKLTKDEPALCKGVRYRAAGGMPTDGEGLSDGRYPNDYGTMTLVGAYADEIVRAITGETGVVPAAEAPGRTGEDPAQNWKKPPEGVKWTKVTTADVEGLVSPSAERREPFQRFPEAFSNLCSRSVWTLQYNTAGVQARFTAPAGRLWLKWRTRIGYSMWHEPGAGVSGLDIYRRDGDGWRYVWTGMTHSAAGSNLALDWPGGDGLVNFALYNGISSLEIGSREGEVKLARPRSEKPVVIYGTSITQGCGASRPGMSHVNAMGRAVNRPIVNLGFSGSGKMEPSMVEAVAETEACCYVLDTVWNMDVKLIGSDCESFVRNLRKRRPGVPIVMCEGCCAFRSPGARRNMETLNAAWRKVYDRLRAEDAAEWANLHYVSDADFQPDGETSVDAIHANDWGMMKMYRALAAAVTRALRPEK